MRKASTVRRRLFASAVVAALALAACGSDSDEDSGEASGSGATDGALSDLADACKEEGKVNLIALPDTWANYKGILQSFRDKYPGVENPVANPDASSKDEMEAVETLTGQDDQPDSVDVSPAIAAEMAEKGLFEPYTLSVDAEIPDGLKDPEGNWTAAYYGIIAITTNTTIVTEGAPTTWADLKDPKYKGVVALNGDPRESGSGLAAVMAASLANGGNPDDIMPGIEFFAELKESGNLAATDVTPETMVSGETPISIDWSYNIPSLQQQLTDAGLEVETHFPSDGIYGGFYGQGVVKGSPHPACAKLWLEHIFSDEGALGYLEGGAVPARIEALTEKGLVSEDATKNLPDEELLSQVKFLTPAQIAKANEVLTENWGPMVADA